MGVEGQPVPLRPLGAGEIIDAAIKVFRRQFGTLVMCVLVVAVPLGVLDTLIQASTNDTAFDFTFEAEEDPAEEFDGAAIGGLAASALISFIVGAVTSAACFRAVSAAYLGAPTTWRESLAFAGKRLHSVIWVLILVGLVSLFGLVFCILPGIWLWVSFQVAQPALLFEDAKGSDALQRSFRLVKGRWWPSFGVVIVGSILVAVVQGVFVFFAGLGLGLAEPTEIVAAAVITVFTIISYALGTPIQAAILSLLYFDLRVRKEGFDLQLLAQRIGAAPAVAEPIAPIGWSTQPPPQPSGPPTWPPAPPAPAPEWPAPEASLPSQPPPSSGGFLPPRPPETGSGE